MRERASTLATLAVIGAATVAALAGCKDGKGSAPTQQGHGASTASPSAPAQPATSPTPSRPPTAKPPSGTARTRLTIEVRKAPSAKPTTWQLTCDPAGGTHPKAGAACQALAKAASKSANPFAPVPKGAVCTKIYGGPEVAKVKGIWTGKKVDAQFSRQDGCQLARWSNLEPMFGDQPPVR